MQGDRKSCVSWLRFKPGVSWQARSCAKKPYHKIFVPEEPSRIITNCSTRALLFICSNKDSSHAQESNSCLMTSLSSQGEPCPAEEAPMAEKKAGESATHPEKGPAQVMGAAAGGGTAAPAVEQQPLPEKDASSTIMPGTHEHNL
jgi:hypothetical protein